MCGIAGKLDFHGPIEEQLLARMCSVMEHRGPDSRGLHLEDGVGLGVQRLAIIDVAGGNQPVFNEDRTVAVVLNGEIYNHEELRADLIAGGHRFSSRVDTEVLAHLYEEHGDELVHRLRGMFAFAIWDRRRRRLLCARDRVGKKPLFWARHGSQLWFASTVQALFQDPALPRRVSPQAIEAFLALQYVPHPLCAFEGVSKLPPASILSVTESGAEVRRYWRLDYRNKLEGAELPELRERLWSELRTATRLRLMSEVPLGAFLSGGIDSSAVVAAMAAESSGPVKTFSIGFPDDQFDELRYARMVAEEFATDHHEFRVEPEAMSILPTMVRHYGEPFADSSAIPSFFLAELTSRHVTVALNGDGGDESFGGYPTYSAGALVDGYRGRLPQTAVRGVAWLGRRLEEGGRGQTRRSRLARRMRVLGMPPWERHGRWMSAFDREERARLFTPEFGREMGEGGFDAVAEGWRQAAASNGLDRMLAVDVETYLPGDLLVKMDVATMAYSVEARSPLLDHRLMEFAAALPPELKLRDGGGKWLLKSALRELLPAEIVDRPKMGFSIPLASWLRRDLRELPVDVLLDPRTVARGYFRTAEVERIIREHRDGVVDHSHRLWALLQLELWHREVVEGPIASAEVR
jgi:asparagine synthase (glutamine-hydrolysing)